MTFLIGGRTAPARDLIALVLALDIGTYQQSIGGIWSVGFSGVSLLNYKEVTVIEAHILCLDQRKT